MTNIDMPIDYRVIHRDLLYGGCTFEIYSDGMVMVYENNTGVVLVHNHLMKLNKLELDHSFEDYDKDMRDSFDDWHSYLLLEKELLG